MADDMRPLVAALSFATGAVAIGVNHFWQLHALDATVLAAFFLGVFLPLTLLATFWETKK